MLELQAVSKRFSKKAVLRALDLSIAARRTTVLLGASGCGKSTVLRLILALIEPDAGEIRFDGRPLREVANDEYRRRIGYVVQSGGLFPHLDARNNVTLVARHLGWERSRISARLEELRELTHLPADALDRFPLQLSGGQRQRVALMRALFLDPALLLLDEPLSALDPMIRRDLQGELARIFRRLAKTVVLVTHDLAEAEWFADDVCLLHEGRVEQFGPPRDLVDRPASSFVSRFVAAQRPRGESASSGSSNAPGAGEAGP